MGDDADRAKFYRERATQVRKRARALSNFDARDSLMLVANSYEAIAESLDRIEETKRIVGLLEL